MPLAALSVEQCDPALPEAVELLRRHLEHVREHSPPGGVYALDLEGLRVPEITFWVARENHNAVGCGALRELDSTHGEIKSMHTLAAHRGRGIGRAITTKILLEATRRNYSRVSLETGSGEAFEGPRGLYASLGFEPCGPFADYPARSHSAFMTLALP